MKRLRHVAEWLRPRLPYLNLGLVLAAWWANDHVDQVFCRPVTWAAWVLAGSTGAFLVWPWLRWGPTWVQYPALFLQGAFLLVCGYCTWFFGWRTYVGSPFYAVLMVWLVLTPLLVWVPVFFAGQVVWQVRAVRLPGARLAFGLGMVGLLAAQGWADYQFRQIEAAVAALPPSQRQHIPALAAVVPRTYLAERLAGTQFKYHNYFCIYDGVRPALHDPLVNVCLWLRGGSDIIDCGVEWSINPRLLSEEMSPSQRALFRPARADTSYAYGDEQQTYLNRQATLYHRLFPALPLNTGCACTPRYGRITVQAR